VPRSVAVSGTSLEVVIVPRHKSLATVIFYEVFQKQSQAIILNLRDCRGRLQRILEEAEVLKHISDDPGLPR